MTLAFESLRMDPVVEWFGQCSRLRAYCPIEDLLESCVVAAEQLSLLHVARNLWFSCRCFSCRESFHMVDPSCSVSDEQSLMVGMCSGWSVSHTNRFPDSQSSWKL